jgi:Holliday junction resolvasome RuvABC endonuclease subunit
MITFISIDPSLSNTALVRGTIESGKITILDSLLVETEKAKTKTVRASSDLIERCTTLHTTVNDYVNLWNPQVLFAETPSGSQSADGMKNYGVSCMLLGSLTLAPIQVTPQEVKMASVGDKKASKAQMIHWATENHPEVKWITTKGKPSPKNEHVADAIAVAYAAIKTAPFKQLASALK